MTGTGTQNDPYIVDNTADFLEAVAQSGAYVQLGSDIDAAADGYDYIGSVTVNALSINGNGYVIRNATFQPGSSNRCFSIGNANTVLRDISFLDCSVKPSGTSATFIYGNLNSFIGMKLSLQAQPSSEFILFDRTNVSNCAADITMNGGIIYIHVGASSLSNSTFYIRGNYGFDRTIKGSNILMLNVYNIGVVFDGSISPSNQTYIGDYTKFVGCYFAFADSASISESGGLAVYLGRYSSTGQNVVFSVGDSLNVTTPSEFPSLTTAQMKSESYLQSIGWLP